MRHFRLYIVLLLLACGCSVDKSAEQFADSLDVEDGYISIAHLRTMYQYAPRTLDEELWIKGVVVSSDRGGNVVRTVAIEDSTGGISILVDSERLFARLYQGDAVTFRCGGLTLGGVGGAVRLGDAPAGDDEVSYIAEDDFYSRLLVEGHFEVAPSAHELELKDVAPRYIGCLVCIDGVQFADSELGKLWCEEDVPTTRYLTDSEGRTIGVRTLPSATFADKQLPNGSGSVTALLDYFGSEYQLTPITLLDVKLENERFLTHIQ